MSSEVGSDSIHVLLTLGGLFSDSGDVGATYFLLFDSDADPGTGVDVGGFPGIDKEIQIHVRGDDSIEPFKVFGLILDREAFTVSLLVPSPVLIVGTEESGLDVPGVPLEHQFEVRIPKDALGLTAMDVPVGVLSVETQIHDTAALVFNRDLFQETPTLTVPREVAAPGENVPFEVSGLTANTDFELSIDDEVVFSGTLDSTGGFAGSFVIPSQFTSGFHFLTAQDSTGLFSISAIEGSPPSARWLYALGDTGGTGTRFDALALTNFSDTTANLDLEAIPAAQQPAILTQSLAGDDNFASLQLQSGEQTARLRSGLFGGDLSLPAWIELLSDTSEIGTFFQFGTTNLSQLDGGVAIGATSRHIALTRIFDGSEAFRGQPATTRVSIFNPNAEPVTIRLTYRPPGNGGSTQGTSTITRIIAPRSVLDDRAIDLFGSSLSGGQGGDQLRGGVLAGEVTEGEGVVAFEVVQLTDQDTVIGLNAATGNPSSRAYSAQLASVPGVFTSVNVFNSSAEDRDVTLRAVNEAGGDQGDPVAFTLEPGEQFTEDAGVLFGGGATPATPSQGAPFRGSLIVEADGDGIVGDVIFGDPDNFAYAASVPLQTETFEEALFNQVANVFGIFTGLAFFYPGAGGGEAPQRGDTQGPAPEAEISIQVYSPSGELLGEGLLTLAAGERVSKLVEELVPLEAGLELTGGYVRVISSEPMIGQMLFGQLGGTGIQYFSAVPPTVLR